jgi:prevent-host-death family protein
VAWPVRMNEDVYGVTDLRDSLPQVVDKATDTRRPMVITKHSRPVAAIVAVDELQDLYDDRDEVEALRDRNAVLEFMLAETRGQVEWLTNAEMSSFIDGISAEAERGA